MKYQAIQQLQGEDQPVKLSCEVLQVSSSGYYSWKDRKTSPREQSNQELVEKIQSIHQESRGSYGEPRIRAHLRSQGILCGKARVVRLMKRSGISGPHKRRFKPQTTDSRHDLPIASRVFQIEKPETLPSAPNRLWAGDISYIPTAEGFLYLAIFLDVFSRKIVGYHMGEQMQTELILQALNQALLQQQPLGSKLMVHSDRGSQYASEAFRIRLKLLEIQASMSRKGNCYDNAYAETFFHSLKTEWLAERSFQTRKEAELAIFEYIETWYNPKRLHSGLNYRSPLDYEKHHLALAA